MKKKRKSEYFSEREKENGVREGGGEKEGRGEKKKEEKQG
jgi:hypothetical protein